MKVINSTSALSKSSLFPAICFDLPVLLKFPDQATPTALASSLYSLVLTSITLPISMFFNSLVLLVLYKKPELRTKFNIAIVAIAFNDIVGGVTEGPLFLFKEASFQAGNQPDCGVKIAFFAIKSFLNLSGVSLVSVLNLETFLSITCPIWHRNHVTKEKVFGASLFSWFIGAALTAIRVFYDEGKAVPIVALALNTLLSYVLILLIWKALSNRNKVSSETGRHNSLFVAAESKAAKTAACLAFGFTLTRIVPLVLMTTLAVRSIWITLPVAEPVFQSLCFVNVLLDPVFFGLMNREIRRNGLLLIKCHEL